MPKREIAFAWTKIRGTKPLKVRVPGDCISCYCIIENCQLNHCLACVRIECHLVSITMVGLEVGSDPSPASVSVPMLHRYPYHNMCVCE